MKSIFLLIFFLLICNADRKLQFTQQLGCDIPQCENGTSNDSFPNLAYIRADGANDSLHYLISSVGLPTVLVVNTHLSADVPTIDWEKWLLGDVSGAVTFNSSVSYSFGVVFTKLYEFNSSDTSTSNMTDYGPYNDTVWKIHDFSLFKWYEMEALDQNAAFVFYASSEGNDTDVDIDKTISLSFFGRNHMDRDKVLPHLLYNENITQIELLLNDFVPNFEYSRFALEMALFSSENDSLPVKLDVAQSLDDEHTPGVFQLDNWLTRVPESPRQAFLQWKPVSYAKPNRTRNDARKLLTYAFKPIAGDETSVRDIFDKTLLYAFYRDGLYSELSLQMMNVSFGLADDGTYTKTNYTVWTMNLGYGTPPNDSVSTMVIVVISCGLGIPVVLMLLGSSYVFCKKRRATRRAASGRNTSFPVVR